MAITGTTMISISQVAVAMMERSSMPICPFASRTAQSQPPRSTAPATGKSFNIVHARVRIRLLLLISGVLFVMSRIDLQERTNNEQAIHGVTLGGGGSPLPHGLSFGRVRLTPVVVCERGR